MVTPLQRSKSINIQVLSQKRRFRKTTSPDRISKRIWNKVFRDQRLSFPKEEGEEEKEEVMASYKRQYQHLKPSTKEKVMARPSIKSITITSVTTTIHHRLLTRWRSGKHPVCPAVRIVTVSVPVRHTVANGVSRQKLSVFSLLTVTRVTSTPDNS